MRNVSVLIVAACVAATLTAAAPTQSIDGCTPPIVPGPASDLIHVFGPSGQQPVIDIPTPLKTSQTQRTIIQPGTGPGLIKGQLISVNFTFINGTTAQIEQQGGYVQGQQPSSIVLNDQTLPGLVNGLLCTQVGSRVAIAITPSDLSPQQGTPVGDDTIVAVIDVVNAYPVKANGIDQPAQPGFPTVVTNDQGVTGVVIPETAPPPGLMITDIKKGNGVVVTDNDTVIVQYTGIVWNKRTVFDSTWQKGSPTSLPTAPGKGIIPGFTSAVNGHTVGSQILAVIPPENAYGNKGIPQVGIPADATLVFVIDILGVA